MRKILTALTGVAVGLALATAGGLAMSARAADSPIRGNAEDRAEIENLMAYYLFDMDWHDADAYASVFTEDGVLTWAGGDVKGRTAIRKFVNDQVAPPQQGTARMPPKSRHFVTNTYLVIKGNKAVSRAYWEQLDANNAEAHAQVGAYGHYEDELVKTNGHWLFTHRAIFNEQVARRKAGDVNPAKGL